jgi:hypothetical protein
LLAGAAGFCAHQPLLVLCDQRFDPVPHIPHSRYRLLNSAFFIDRNRERIAKKFTTTPVFKDWEPQATVIG